MPGRHVQGPLAGERYETPASGLIREMRALENDARALHPGYVTPQSKRPSAFRKDTAASVARHAHNTWHHVAHDVVK